MRRGPWWFFALAGACDTATGAGLLAAPSLVLRAMGVGSGPADPTLVRFVGAFVLGVGLAYLGVALRQPRPGRARAVAEATVAIRASVGLFVTVALASGALPLPWISVPITDLGLAAAQVWLLARGWFDDAA